MSTDYSITLTEPGGISGTITLIDSILPLPAADSWVATDMSQWDTAGGAASWGSGDVYLTGPLGVHSIVLFGFTKDTQPGHTGSGDKNYEDGSFPIGSLTWHCTAKD